MSRFKDYFSTASNDYRRFRPEYPPELFQWLSQQAPAQQRAVDVGCGNGQASVALAVHFDEVIATDASAAQIEQAQAAAGVQYQTSPAESIPAADSSIDLIALAQAIHWFDHPRFFAEVDRVLKPGGVLAVWGYQLLYTDTDLDAVIEHFHSQVVGPYWPPERALLDNGYSRIAFPWPRLPAPAFRMGARWSFRHLLGYLNTWSAVKQYEKAQGHNPVEKHLDTLLAAWGDPDSAKEIYWPLILYVGKKATPAG